MPLISIIMPSYNSASYIVPAIQSIIDQTFTDWELFIFDDGSTDHTESVVAPFLSDSRIQYIKQENMGQPKTRNHGVRLSRGSLIALLDADDIWKPQKLEEQVRIFEQYPDVGVCGAVSELINPAGKVIRIPLPQPDFYGRALPALVTRSLTIDMSASVTRKEVFKKVGYFDEGHLPFSMDYDFWLRAAMEFNFYRIGHVLLQYRQGHPSISSHNADRRRLLVQNIVLPRFLKEYGGSRYVKWYHVWHWRSRTCHERASEKQQWSPKVYWLVRAFLYNPFYHEVWGALARCFLPGSVVDLVKRMTGIQSKMQKTQDSHKD